MKIPPPWPKILWDSPLWDIVRFYRAIRGSKKQTEFRETLSKERAFVVDGQKIKTDPRIVELFFAYEEILNTSLVHCESMLRDEKQALDFCKNNGYSVGVTQTKNKQHHQSSKAMIASVNGVTLKKCIEKGANFNDDPQSRCIWLADDQLHTTSRNLDGAIPGLLNPTIIWEIKEYWGNTKGGSKMSDAVYECQLVGKELRDFEAKTGLRVKHVVFLDGKHQWSFRRSDLVRFIDLNFQGLIDLLIVGKEVESDWEEYLESFL